MLRFALDQNFPVPVVESLKDYLIEAQLESVREIDTRLATFDDWELLLALHHCEPRCDGLVTTDSSMTSLPREMAVLLQTKLTLVVAAESGHDPLKATGLVLAHLPQITKRVRADRAQIWTLRATTRQHEDPWTHIGKLATRRKQTAKAVYDSARLTERELAANPLLKKPT